MEEAQIIVDETSTGTAAGRRLKFSELIDSKSSLAAPISTDLQKLFSPFIVLF